MDDTLQVFSDEQRDLLRMLGYLQLQHGSPGKAAAIFDVLSATQTSDPILALSHVCALLRSGQSAEALAALEASGAQDFSGEQLTLAWLLRGQALARLGRVAEAARAMRMFIRQRHADAAKA
ncbi:MAG: hypothetical protein RL404_1321 [Pseudomonadota bacterium]|jgi:predicted Zn-dependent protease